MNPLGNGISGTGRTRRLPWAVAGLALLPACAAPVDPLVPIGFAGKPPLVLDVAAIGTENRHRPAEKDVERLFRQPPAEVVRAWVRDRLRASGSGGTLHVTLRRASVTETPPGPVGGVRALIAPERRYEAVVDLSVEIADASGVRHRIDVTVRRARTVSDNVSLNEREAIWHGMARALGEALDRTLEAEIRKGLGGWLRPPPN